MVFLFKGIKCFLLFFFIIFIMFCCRLIWFMVKLISLFMCKLVVYNIFSMFLLWYFMVLFVWGVCNKFFICCLFNDEGNVLGILGLVKVEMGLFICICCVIKYIKKVCMVFIVCCVLWVDKFLLWWCVKYFCSNLVFKILMFFNFWLL